MWVTEIFAEFVQAMRPEDLPPGVFEIARRCILDLLGSAAAGFNSPAARAVRALSVKNFSGGASRAWFSGHRLNPATAAIVNSASASALDLDDGHREAGGHPGSSVIPAALAVAEEVGAGQGELIAAIAAGYEVCVRISSARDFSKLDTLSTGRWCAYGAAAAGGFLRKTRPDVLAQAFAIAGVLSPGLSASGYSTLMGNNTKEGIPWATMTGLAALDLAEQGFTGPLDILDHPAYYDRGKIVKDLQDSFAILKVYFKPYSCCRWIHSALDALFGMMESHGLTPEHIKSVQVHTFERALRLNNYPDPENLEAAQYSIPFCLALGAVCGRGALLPVRAESLGRPGIIEFAKKISLHVDPDLDRMFPLRTPARLVLKTGWGDFETVVRDAKGDHTNLMHLSELEAKFRTLTEGIMQKERREALIECVNGLDSEGLDCLLELIAEPL